MARVHVGHETGMACVVIVRFEKQLARFFVQCRFGIRVDEEAVGSHRITNQRSVYIPAPHDPGSSPSHPHHLTVISCGTRGE